MADMTENWVFRLGTGLAALVNYRPGYRPGEFVDPELDADLRRTRTELDAIRIRFPDHS